MSSKEFDIKTDDIGHHLKTTESQKRNEFIVRKKIRNRSNMWKF